MGERVKDIDFWRGAAQIAILVDHIPGSLLDRLTPMNFGFSDAAEAFVFLSGVSVGLAHISKARILGVAAVAGACARRARTIYAVHIALTFIALALFALLYRFTGFEGFAKAPSFTLELSSAKDWLALFVLQYQLNFFNVLPLYVLLLLSAPVSVVLASRRPLLCLMVSAAVYVVARLTFHVLPTVGFENNGLFFNPFTWQLVFTIGVVCSEKIRRGDLQPSVLLVGVSVAIVLASLVVMTLASGLAPAFARATVAHLDLYKPRLGLGRLTHFMALAYLVGVVSIKFEFVASIIGGLPGRVLQALGRNSLAVYSVGCLLSAGARAAIAFASERASSSVFLGVRATCALTAVVLLVGVGLWIDRGMAPNDPAPRASSARTRGIPSPFRVFAFARRTGAARNVEGARLD